jgi:hypothetical protein
MVESTEKRLKLKIVHKDKNGAEKTANMIQSNFKNFKTKAAWISSTGNNRFEAVIICADDQEDYDLLSDMLIRYQSCPVVAFFGKDLTLEDEFKHAKVFDDKEACANWIAEAIAAEKVNVNSMFEKMDTDKSGFLEENELAAVIAEMGVEMSGSDVRNMMTDIDFNKDGKISPEEFHMWWLSGRKGTTGTMKQLVSQGLGGKSFFTAASNTAKALSNSAVKSTKMKSSSMEVSINESEIATDGNQFYATAQQFGSDTE